MGRLRRAGPTWDRLQRAIEAKGTVRLPRECWSSYYGHLARWGQVRGAGVVWGLELVEVQPCWDGGLTQRLLRLTRGQLFVAALEHERTSTEGLRRHLGWLRDQAKLARVDRVRAAIGCGART